MADRDELIRLRRAQAQLAAKITDIERRHEALARARQVAFSDVPVTVTGDDGDRAVQDVPVTDLMQDAADALNAAAAATITADQAVSDLTGLQEEIEAIVGQEIPGLADQLATLTQESNATRLDVEGLNIIISRVPDLEDAQDQTQTELSEMQAYYSFGATGAIIGRPDSDYKLVLQADRISIVRGNPDDPNGHTVVSYWDNDSMFVESFVGDRVVLGNHTIEKFEGGTVVRF